MKKIVFISILAVFLISCEKSSNLNALVPATVAENHELPSLKLKVAGIERLVHYRTFGDPNNPVMLIIHGSLSDMRAFLPFSVFAEKYHVVMWDLRGNGLSERCTAQELKTDEMVNEIQAVKQIFSPDQPVTLIGHSWGGLFAARYIGLHGQAVEQAVLIEPYMLHDTIADQANVELNLFTPVFLDMTYQSDFLSAKDHEMLDYQGLAIQSSGTTNFYCDPDDLPDWPVWRLGIYAVICWEKEITNGTSFNYDFTRGLAGFPRNVLLVGSSCSPVGYDFQLKYHKPLFGNAEVLRIENAGHRIPVEQFDTLVAGMKTYLTPYKN